MAILLVELFPSHTIYVWNIYLHEWSVFMVDVGKYTIHGNSAGDLFGMVSSRDPFEWLASWPPTIGDEKVTNWITWLPKIFFAMAIFEGQIWVINLHSGKVTWLLENPHFQ